MCRFTFSWLYSYSPAHPCWRTKLAECLVIPSQLVFPKLTRNCLQYIKHFGYILEIYIFWYLKKLVGHSQLCACVSLIFLKKGVGISFFFSLFFVRYFCLFLRTNDHRFLESSSCTVVAILHFALLEQNSQLLLRTYTAQSLPFLLIRATDTKQPVRVQYCPDTKA